MKNKTLQRTYKMLSPHIKTVIIVSFLALIVNVGAIARPYLIKVAIDDYLTLGIFEKAGITVTTIALVYIGIVIVEYALNFISTIITSVMGEKVIYDLRNSLFKYIQYANTPFHDKTPAGKLFVRITSDVEDITNLFKEVITTILKDIIIIISLIILMLNLDTKLALYAFIVIPMVMISSIILTRITRKIYKKSKEERTKLTTFLAESIYGVKLIKVFNRQNEKLKECDRLGQNFCKVRIPAGIFDGLLFSMINIFENIGISIIIWACVGNWTGSMLEIGVIYMFTSYIKQIFEPINRIIENVETVQEAFESIDKIYEILEKTKSLEDLENGIVLDKIEGKIEFKNVWFSYEKDNWVLKNVSFCIEPGQSIALVGKTGSRKNHNNKSYK